MIRIHLLVPMADGPVVSTGGPAIAGPPEIQSTLGRGTVGTPGRYGIACDPSLILGDGVNHGTDKTYLVHCPRCKALDVFKEIAKTQPDPRKPRESADEVET